MGTPLFTDPATARFTDLAVEILQGARLSDLTPAFLNDAETALLAAFEDHCITRDPAGQITGYTLVPLILGWVTVTGAILAFGADNDRTDADWVILAMRDILDIETGRTPGPAGYDD